MSAEPAVVIVGAGFAGLGMAIKLKQAGFDDFVVLEKNDDLGGAWRDNTYPGCACDVPSHMYSFSFELNPGWTRMFAPQQEIWDYLHRTADKYGVTPHIKYNSPVESLEFDDAALRWTVTVGESTVYRPRAVVHGIGGLHVPAYPSIPGLDDFKGTAFHSARWDHSYDLTGKRVAVIGTGASAVQFVPEVAKRAGRLHLFQRTPPWIQHKPDVPIPAPVRTALKVVPGLTRAFRTNVYWTLEGRAAGFALDRRLAAPQAWRARRHLARQVPDPELRAKLAPDYAFGCKRVLLSNNYYPALTRPNVDVITDGIAAVREHSIVTTDGREFEVDAIIYGTGFQVTETLMGQHIVGRDGLKIQEAWAAGAEAHHGITVPGFPNLFFLVGPNTGLGHNSIVFMIESQVQHIMGCLRMIAEHQAQTIEVKPEATRRYNDKIQRRLRRSVWNEGGCQSWYLDAQGVNRTLWPGFTFEYWKATRKPRPADYVLRK